MQKRIALFFASLVATVTIAACESRSPGQVEPTAGAPVAVPAELTTLEAQQICLPRLCGRIPICPANTRARCSPDTECHWRCVPLNDPL